MFGLTVAANVLCVAARRVRVGHSDNYMVYLYVVVRRIDVGIHDS